MSDRVTEQSDVVIVGAGISGLVDAILLAETGRRVVVFEQHTIPGGYLQQFRRKKTTFDVGFHYMGSTRPGHPMRQFLEYLQIWDRLEVVALPAENAIDVRRGEQRFGYPTRFDRFHEKCHQVWPHQRAAIDRLVDETEALCAQYKWFALKQGREYQNPLDMDHAPISFQEYMGEWIDDPWLRSVLSFMTFNLGLFAHEIPWTKHLLAFRSNFDETSRIVGGGGALVDALVARGKALGVDYRFGNGIERYECEGRRVVAAEASDGTRISAELFVAACHPKTVVDRIDDADLKPMYKERVRNFKDSRGAVQLFLRLSEPLESIGSSCIMVHDEEEAARNFPLDTLLITQPSTIEPGSPPRLEAMTYMHQAPFERWRDTRIFKRGDDYDRLKDELADRMVAMIARHAPELPARVTDRYTATPLTDEHYTKNANGGVFGVSHDIAQMGTQRPMPRMRFRNLFFTGHSITMPGICGTFINAFDTCDLIRADAALFNAVAT